MGIPDRASVSSRSSRLRPRTSTRLGSVTNGALAGLLGACGLAGYVGCSSSAAPPATTNDAGTTPPSNDASVLDSTVPPVPDAAVVDSSPTPEAAPPPVDQAAPDAPAPVDSSTNAIDCTNNDGGGGLVENLECTGLYSDWASKTIAPANLPYTPGYVLWSDNANKARYVYLPPGTKIDTTDMDNWVFPVGTKVWKEFSLGPLRIETRLFVKVGPNVGDWAWTTYRWSPDGETTATKLDSGETAVNGTSYEIPAHGQCLQCHGGRPDMVLGLEAITLGASTAVGVSLATLTAQSQLTTPPPASLEIPEDATGHARAALGWLHMNCGAPCHNANPGALAAGTGLFLKTSAAQLVAGGGAVTTSQLTPYVTAVNVVPNMQPFASEGFYRIHPGHPETSLVPTLDSARNQPNIPQMPPLISHLVDTKDVNVLTTWITTMPIPDAGPGPVDAGQGD